MLEIEKLDKAIEHLDKSLIDENSKWSKEEYAQLKEWLIELRGIKERVYDEEYHRMYAIWNS